MNAVVVHDVKKYEIVKTVAFDPEILCVNEKKHK